MPITRKDSTEKTSSSLSVRGSTQNKRMPKTGNWGPSEDFRLRQAVSKHGPRWVLVAEEVGTRNGDQCAKRWKDRLNPELDHSQWSPDEDDRLLNLVDICGHNWKFIAENFFQSRAPLSLKNRNSLLMRRLKRQAVDGGRIQEQVNIDALKRYMQTTVEPAQHVSDLTPSNTSGTTGSPGGWPGDATDTGDFTGANQAATYGSQKASHEQPSSATNDFNIMWSSELPLFTEAVAIETVPVRDSPDDVARNEGASNARVICSIPFSPWGDQDLTSWPQDFQSSFIPTSADVEFMPGEVSGNSSDLGWRGIPTRPQRGKAAINEQMPNVSQLAGRGPHGSGSKDPIHDDQASKAAHGRDDLPPAVEYSVTCRRGKVRAFVNHLIDAGISDIAERVAEDENVTIKLRIDV